jgi:hypothetical protein
MIRTLALFLALTACRTAATAGRAADDVAAIVVQPSDASRAEIAAAVSAALGARVTLSDYALTGSSVLLVEHLQAASEPRPPLPPEEFQLFRGRTGCVLVYWGTGRRAPLSATDCAPETVGETPPPRLEEQQALR